MTPEPATGRTTRRGNTMAKRSSRTSRTPRARRPTRPQASTARDRRASQSPMPSPPPPPPPPAPGDVYVATCRGLLALAAPAERDDARAQSIAEVAVREAIGEGYRVESLGPGARDYRVSRADGALLTPGTAWTLTRALMAHR